MGSGQNCLGWYFNSSSQRTLCFFAKRLGCCIHLTHPQSITQLTYQEKSFKPFAHKWVDDILLLPLLFTLPSNSAVHFIRHCEKAMQYPSSPEHPEPVELDRSCNHVDSQTGKYMDGKQTGKSMDGNRTGKPMIPDQTRKPVDEDQTGKPDPWMGTKRANPWMGTKQGNPCNRTKQANPCKRTKQANL